MSPEMLGVVIGVAGGLLGTFLGGLISFFTVRVQLNHESKERERERKLSLKRDVYLEAAEALGKSQVFLSSFTRQDLDPASLAEQLKEIPGSLNKAQLVASEETYAALEDFGDVMASRAADLVILKIRSTHVQGKIEEQQNLVAQLRQYYSFVHGRLSSLPAGDPAFQNGMAELQSAQSQLDLAYDSLAKLTDLNVRITKELGQETVKATLAARSEVGKVNVQIRREIEMPIDEGWFRERLAQRSTGFQSKMDEVYAKVDKILEETDNL